MNSMQWSGLVKQWEVWDEERGARREDATKVRARDHAEAAEKYAEQDDAEGDYGIVGGNSVIVHVAAVNSVDVRKVFVEGEPVPQYCAREVK